MSQGSRDVAVPDRVSLAELLDLPIEPTAQEAVGLIVQLARSPQMGRPRAVKLDASHVWLHADGTVTLSPGLLPPLSDVAGLLAGLLSRAEATETVPLGLRSIVQRAESHDGFSIPSLGAFAAALAPFQPPDPADAVRALIAAMDQPSTAAPPALPDPEPTPEPTVSIATAPGIDAIHEPSPLPPPLPPPQSQPLASWRPSTWQVTGAIAATVLASMAGGAVGRWRHDDTGRPDVRAEASAPATREVASTPPATTREPEPIVAPTKRVAPRPARLVDRRAVHADGVFSPSFAPHGSAIFFHAEEGAESALKRAELDDRGELRVATIVDDGARNYHVQLSPDGASIAFDSDREGERGVYLAKADGTGVHRVSGPGYAAVPAWSPDGRRLAMVRAEPDRPEVWNLWLLDRDSGRQTRVTTFTSGQVRGGAWFADGKRIAYGHGDRLSIHDLASGKAREFASPLGGRPVRTPAVSPDGRWIVFQVYRDGAWLLDVERGAMQRVLQDPSAEEFAWSPDGRRVAYHSQRSGGWNLWTMAAP